MKAAAFNGSPKKEGNIYHAIRMVADRRSGGLPVFDRLNNFMNYSEMILPSSNYWNVAYGAAPGEARQDENMAWLMKVMEAGKQQVNEPSREEKEFMNFIR